MLAEHERGMRVRTLKRRASPKIAATRELDISTYCSPLYGGEQASPAFFVSVSKFTIPGLYKVSKLTFIFVHLGIFISTRSQRVFNSNFFDTSPISY